MTGHSTGRIQFFGGERFGCGRTTDGLDTILAAQRNTDLLARAKILFLPIGNDSARPTEETHLHLAVLDRL